MIHLGFLTLFWHPLGQCAGSAHEVSRCKSYNWWSGIGAVVFGELAALGILITLFKHVNCHVNSPHFCFRYGHPVPGTSFRACHKHHPGRETGGKVTAENILHAHRHQEATEPSYRHKEEVP